MKNFYILDFLKKNSNVDSKKLEILKQEFDFRFYSYGNQFKNPHENKKQKFYAVILQYLKSVYILLKIFQNKKADNNKKTILSSAYFNVNNELSKLGFEVYSPSWYLKKGGNVLPNLSLFHSSKKILTTLSSSNFRDLLTPYFISQIDKFEKKVLEALQINNIQAVIVSNDMTFIDKILIDVCKKLKIPSFLFLHGLPLNYNLMDNNRTDYLIVWGEKLKEIFIKKGFNKDKIIVSGHPYYKLKVDSPLQFSLDNILVLTKPMEELQFSDKVLLSDRSNSILYLFSIEKALRSFGVNSVRIRIHPGENPEWYYQYINKEFFILDKLNLKKSINKSTLVIGPTSTVFLESIYYCRNYLVYEPGVYGFDLFNHKLFPPFDGSENKVPVANNEVELIQLIKDKTIVDSSILSDYLRTPFDLEIIKKII
jgi:hypothetical protein